MKYTYLLPSSAHFALFLLVIAVIKVLNTLKQSTLKQSIYIKYEESSAPFILKHMRQPKAIVNLHFFFPLGF